MALKVVEELNQMNKFCNTRRSTVQHTKDRIGEFLKEMGKLSKA
jgi:hypothetical protein